MRLSRFAGSQLHLGSMILVLVGASAGCGDDSDGGTSSGGGSTSEASSATGSVTSTGTGTSSSGGDASGGAGGAGSGGDGGAGGAALEVIEGPGFRSGSRLRPVYLDGGDGARKLLHWYDIELGLPCRFSEDTPGGEAWSCFPLGGGARIAFTDESCVEPVIVVTEEACNDRFSDESEGSEIVFANATTLMARGTRTIYERGEELATTPALFARNYAGCEPLDVEQGERVHEVHEPTIALVTATREMESLGDGLARAIAHGDDGSMQLMGPFHEDSASPCQYLLNTATEDGGGSCAPAVIAEFASPTTYSGLIHHADDACSVPAASFFTGDYVPEPPAYVVGPSDAQGELVAYERGDELDVAYRTQGAGECAEHGLHVHHYAVGEPLDMTFPLIFNVDGPGSRLGSRTAGSASGEIAETSYSFADADFGGVSCGPAVFDDENADGDAPIRCVPGAEAPHALHYIPVDDGRYFSDPACSEPLVDDWWRTVAYTAGTAADEDGCTQQIVRQVVTRAALFEPHEGDVYRVQGDAGCTLRDANDGLRFSRYVRDLVPEDFAVLTVVDPAADAP